MEYKGINYNIVLTYKCTNCGVVDFVNPEVKAFDGKEAIQVSPEFMNFVIGDGPPVPVDAPPLTHKCNFASSGPVTIAPMKFTLIEVREIDPEVTAENEKTEIENLNNGEQDGTE